jgi:hypothetical protein
VLETALPPQTVKGLYLNKRDVFVQGNLARFHRNNASQTLIEGVWSGGCRSCTVKKRKQLPSHV